VPEAPTIARTLANDFQVENRRSAGREHAAVSLGTVGAILARRWRLVLGIEGGLLVLCLLYCLFAPKEYEATARVEMRTAPASPLVQGASGLLASGSSFSAPTALETVAGVLRSDELAWRVVTGLKLDEAPGFRGNFARRFPGFRRETPTPEGQAWLLERFADRLSVETLPRTLLIEVRFRSRDAALSAAVVNALLQAYDEQDVESREKATARASSGLAAQLRELKAHVERDGQRLAEYQAAHGIVSTAQTGSGGQPGETLHNATGFEIDELSRQLVEARYDRILREADYRAASQGDPEMVIAAAPRLQTENGGFALGVLQQIHTRTSELEQERAQLSAEYGPNFPRAVEIGQQLQDLERQKQAEDARLVERFRKNWQTALDREQLVSQSLAQATAEGLGENRAETEYAAMRQEANASHEVYLQMLERVEEAGLTAGTEGSNLAVVDAARQPVKPAIPDPWLDFPITLFTGLWLALGAVFVRERMEHGARAALMAVLVLGGVVRTLGQAPTPSTSGLPTGVASFPQTPETRSAPNPREAPPVWNGGPGAATGGLPPLASRRSAMSMPAPIAAGDLVEVTESHLAEFRSLEHVSAAGTVTLPLVGEVKILGMDELGAAHAIDSALVAKGMLRHPVVSVLVIGYVGEDVSVLGEVARPGVYPYAYHHRLLDLIAAASGLSPAAGRLVTVFHVHDPQTPHPVVLDPSGTDAAGDHNPELSPGDTVQVSRAGLVYVVGDVIRPGGFPVDPVQGLTVVQAVSLAWGPTMNASLRKAVLIREQKGGRTLTSLNLKRLLRGQDPDEAVQDRDIIYVPDSTGKNLLNRTMESAIQSTIGVTIYSGLVYSQRY
jgi:polysaccharide export outer membrane protein